MKKLLAIVASLCLTPLTYAGGFTAGFYGPIEACPGDLVTMRAELGPNPPYSESIEGGQLFVTDRDYNVISQYDGEIPFTTEPWGFEALIDVVVPEDTYEFFRYQLIWQNFYVDGEFFDGIGLVIELYTAMTGCCPGDFNGDNWVGNPDIIFVISHWEEYGQNAILEILSNWGLQCCEDC